MFKGNCTLLKAEGGEISSGTNKGRKYYKGALLTDAGDVIKVGMNATVFATVEALTAQSIRGVAEIKLASQTYDGREQLKALLLAFTPEKK